MNWLKAQWAANGTKILGYGGTLISCITLLDRETIDLIGGTFGPKWGPVVTHGLTIAGGLSVAYRGHMNSRRE